MRWGCSWQLPAHAMDPWFRQWRLAEPAGSRPGCRVAGIWLASKKSVGIFYWMW